MSQKLLLWCGVFSALLYVAMNVIAPFGYPGYDVVGQTVSELSAVGAPTREFWLWTAFPYTALSLGFGWGVWRADRENRQLRVTGALLLASAALGLFWPFAPMHQRVVLAAGGGTVSDVLHIVLSVVTVALFLLTVGFGGAATSGRFRWYSVMTILALCVFGALTGMSGPAIGRDEPTPWLGVWERIDIGVYLAWVVALARMLLSSVRSGPGGNAD